MSIKNQRNNLDHAFLINPIWEGIQQGNDGYPKKAEKEGWHLIGGG